MWGKACKHAVVAFTLAAPLYSLLPYAELAAALYGLQSYGDRHVRSDHSTQAHMAE